MFHLCIFFHFIFYDELQGRNDGVAFLCKGDAFCAKPQSVLIESCPNSVSLILDLQVINNVLKDLQCALGGPSVNCQKEKTFQINSLCSSNIF